ncbi:MAG: class I SAM-dependent methyltransferase [Acidimicrobiia bacterium]
MDPDTMQQMWDGRYRERGAVWGSEPNRFLVDVASDLEPGTALDLGCGQGRNALWLASRGFTVTGLDLSPVAVGQAEEMAAELGVDATFKAVDLMAWDPEGRVWDLVLLAYLHLPDAMRKAVHAAAVRAVAPGGRIVVIAHHLDNLESGTGGPSNPDWLFTQAQLADDFSSLTIVRNERVVRPTEQGDALDVVCVALV